MAKHNILYSDSPLQSLINDILNKIKELTQKYSKDDSPEKKEALELIQAIDTIISSLSDLISQRLDDQQKPIPTSLLWPSSLNALRKLISPALTLKRLLAPKEDGSRFQIKHPMLLELLLFMPELINRMPENLEGLVPFFNPDVPGHFISQKKQLANLLNSSLIQGAASTFEMNQPVEYTFVEFMPDNRKLEEAQFYVSFNKENPESFNYTVKASSALIEYKLELVSAQNKKHVQNTIYLQGDNDVLKYEVIGSDGTLKEGSIAWEILPSKLRQDFPQKKGEMGKFQEKWLQTLLAYTSDAGHTCLIEDEINLADIKDLYYEGCSLLKNPKSLKFSELQKSLDKNTIILTTTLDKGCSPKETLYYVDLHKKTVCEIEVKNNNEYTINALKERFTDEIKTADDGELQLITSLTAVTHLNLLPLTIENLNTIKKHILEIISARKHTHTALSLVAEIIMQCGIETIENWYAFSTESPKGCGLFSISDDPSQCSFEEIEGLLNNRDAIILFEQALFYADKTTREIRKIDTEINNTKDLSDTITDRYRLANKRDLKKIIKLTDKNHCEEKIGTIYLSVDLINNLLKYHIVDQAIITIKNVDEQNHLEGNPSSIVIIEDTIPLDKLSLKKPFQDPLTNDQITPKLHQEILNITRARNQTHDHSPYSYHWAFNDFSGQIDVGYLYSFFIEMAKKGEKKEVKLSNNFHRCFVLHPNSEYVKNEIQRSQTLIDWMDKELITLGSAFSEEENDENNPAARNLIFQSAEERLQEIEKQLTHYHLKKQQYETYQGQLAKYKADYESLTFGDLLRNSQGALSKDDAQHPDRQKRLQDLLALRHIKIDAGLSIIPEEHLDSYQATLTQSEYILTRAKECGFIRLTVDPMKAEFATIEPLLTCDNSVILFNNIFYYVDKNNKKIDVIQLVDGQQKEFKALKSKFKTSYQIANKEELKLILNLTNHPNLKQQLYFYNEKTNSTKPRSLNTKKLHEFTDYVANNFDGMDGGEKVPKLSSEQQAKITYIIEHAPGMTTIVPVLSVLSNFIEKKSAQYKLQSQEQEQEINQLMFEQQAVKKEWCVATERNYFIKGKKLSLSLDKMVIERIPNQNNLDTRQKSLKNAIKNSETHIESVSKISETLKAQFSLPEDSKRWDEKGDAQKALDRIAATCQKAVDEKNSVLIRTYIELQKSLSDVKIKQLHELLQTISVEEPIANNEQESIEEQLDTVNNNFQKIEQQIAQVTVISNDARILSFDLSKKLKKLDVKNTVEIFFSEQKARLIEAIDKQVMQLTSYQRNLQQTRSNLEYKKNLSSANPVMMKEMKRTFDSQSEECAKKIQSFKVTYDEATHTLQEKQNELITLQHSQDRLNSISQSQRLEKQQNIDDLLRLIPGSENETITMSTSHEQLNGIFSFLVSEAGVSTSGLKAFFSGTDKAIYEKAGKLLALVDDCLDDVGKTGFQIIDEKIQQEFNQTNGLKSILLPLLDINNKTWENLPQITADSREVNKYRDSLKKAIKIKQVQLQDVSGVLNSQGKITVYLKSILDCESLIKENQKTLEEMSLRRQTVEKERIVCQEQVNQSQENIQKLTEEQAKKTNDSTCLLKLMTSLTDIKELRKAIDKHFSDVKKDFLTDVNLFQSVNELNNFYTTLINHFTQTKEYVDGTDGSVIFQENLKAIASMFQTERTRINDLIKDNAFNTVSKINDSLLTHQNDYEMLRSLFKATSKAVSEENISILLAHYRDSHQLVSCYGQSIEACSKNMAQIDQSCGDALHAPLDNYTSLQTNINVLGEEIMDFFLSEFLNTAPKHNNQYNENKEELLTNYAEILKKASNKLNILPNSQKLEELARVIGINDKKLHHIKKERQRVSQRIKTQGREVMTYFSDQFAKTARDAEVFLGITRNESEVLCTNNANKLQSIFTYIEKLPNDEQLNELAPVFSMAAGSLKLIKDERQRALQVVEKNRASNHRLQARIEARKQFVTNTLIGNILSSYSTLLQHKSHIAGLFNRDKRTDLMNELNTALISYSSSGESSSTLNLLRRKLVLFNGDLQLQSLMNQLIVELVDADRSVPENYHVEPVAEDADQLSEQAQIHLNALRDSSDARKIAYADKLQQLYTEIERLRHHHEGPLGNAMKVDVDRFISKHEEALPDANSYREFQANFTARLHSQDYAMSQHSKTWRPLVANILLALSGIGLIVLVGKAVYSKIQYDRFKFFQTNEQESVDHLEALVRTVEVRS